MNLDMTILFSFLEFDPIRYPCDMNTYTDTSWINQHFQIRQINHDLLIFIGQKINHAIFYVSKLLFYLAKSYFNENLDFCNFCVPILMQINTFGKQHLCKDNSFIYASWLRTQVLTHKPPSGSIVINLCNIVAGVPR